MMDEVVPAILSLKNLCLKEKEGNHATFIVTTFSILSNCYWLNSPPSTKMKLIIFSFQNVDI